MSISQAKNIGLPLMNLVRFKGVPIIKQLQLEEWLLRTSSGNWCIINDGTNAPAIVMGLSGDDVPGVQPYPRSIMHWSGLLYEAVFEGIGNFQLRENDYVFGNRKFGGNAQSITRKRWIHHTSFLWDFESGNMAYLKLPRKAPAYRSARDHLEFVCRMKDYMGRSEFIDKTTKAFQKHFVLKAENLDSDASVNNSGFDYSTRLLTRRELEEASGICL